MRSLPPFPWPALACAEKLVAAYGGAYKNLVSAPGWAGGRVRPSSHQSCVPVA